MCNDVHFLTIIKSKGEAIREWINISVDNSVLSWGNCVNSILILGESSTSNIEVGLFKVEVILCCISHIYYSTIVAE